MKLDRRAIVVCIALASLAALLLFKFGTTPPETDTFPDEEPAAPTPASQPERALFKRQAQGPVPELMVLASEQGAAGSASPAVTQACQACRESECTDFRGTGLDMLGGCTARINSAYGADPNDDRFIADCTAVLQCAAQTHCADSPIGLPACYCGSRTIDECIERGPASDAPCVAQWQRATRTQENEELAARFSDPKYPAGWAHYVLRCDHTRCNSECTKTGAGI